MTLLRLLMMKGGQAAPPGASNSPPVWDFQPSINFVFGVSKSYDMDDITSDPDLDTITFSMNTGTVALPSGVTWTAGTGVLAYDGVGVVASTSGHIITLDDGTDTTASDAFGIAIAESAQQFPLTYSARGGSFNWAQTGTLAAADRDAIGTLDACHCLGYMGTFPLDSDPPGSNYVSRAVGYQEILDANSDNTHVLYTYFSFAEALENNDFIDQYIQTLDGPGNHDGYARDAADLKVVKFTSGSPTYFINNSSYCADKAGLQYCEWHADNVVDPQLVDVMVAAGVPVAGFGACNVMIDNYEHHSNKSGIDWDNNGVEDDAQDYYDSEEAGHVAGSAVAVTAYSSLREHMSIGRARIISNNPGMFILTNTNQWADDPDTSQGWSGPVSGLRNCILEYRLDGATDQADINGGFSEGNSSNGFNKSGVNSAGVNNGLSGSWQRTYNTAYQSVRLSQWPSIVPCSFWVQCLESGVDGDAGLKIYSHIPKSTAVWSMARWAMCTAWLAGAHAAITGIQVGASTAGRANSSPHFDEYGLINTGTTGLSKKWMGAAVGNPPTVAHDGTLWIREFDNALIIINTDNDEANADATVDVSGLPGGATAWKRITGFQDSSWNDGSNVSSDFNIPPIDAIVLERR